MPQLPSQPTGPGATGTVNFRTPTGAIRQVGLTLWRVPCSATKGAFVITVEGPPGERLLMPFFFGSQAGNDFLLRFNTEPNTWLAMTLEFSLPASGVQTFVADLSIFAALPDLNQPFTISAEYPPSASVLNPFQVAAYNASLYPPVGNHVLTGYLTGSYFDPARSGEGMLLEIAEVGATRLAVVSWYTFDNDGFPLWLIGAAPIDGAATSSTIQLASKGGGGFAGQFDPSELVDLPWGQITITFPTCSTLRFTYQASHSVPFLPQGSGERTWTRLTSVNGLACE
jgi:hypothetical protein